MDMAGEQKSTPDTAPGLPQELQSLVDAACVDLCQGLDALSIPHRPKAAPTP